MRTALLVFACIVRLSNCSKRKLFLFLGYEEGCEVVLDKRTVVKHYLKTWFTIDLIATMPWDSMLSSTNVNTDDLSMLRLLKIFRLLRVGRLISKCVFLRSTFKFGFRNMQCVMYENAFFQNSLTSSWTIHTGYIEAAKFFFYVLVVAHLLAVGFCCLLLIT